MESEQVRLFNFNVFMTPNFILLLFHIWDKVFHLYLISHLGCHYISFILFFFVDIKSDLVLFSDRIACFKTWSGEIFDINFTYHLSSLNSNVSVELSNSVKMLSLIHSQLNRHRAVTRQRAATLAACQLTLKATFTGKQPAWDNVHCNTTARGGGDWWAQGGWQRPTCAGRLSLGQTTWV